MSKSKQTGTEWETRSARYLTERGVKVIRRGLEGKNDKGDLYGAPYSIIECKGTKSYDLAGMMREAVIEAHNANEVFPFGLQKKFGGRTGDAYLVLPFSFAPLLFTILGAIEPERMEVFVEQSMPAKAVKEAK